jgi:hypothetical protein
MGKLKQIGIDVDVHRAIEGGRRTFSESENDILRRLLSIVQSQQAQPSFSSVSIERSRGNWTVRIDGAASSAKNLKDAYCQFIAGLATRSPEFLIDFSQEKSRARKFVARRPDELYQNSPHLAADHAVEFLPGWYIDTNLSEEQVTRRIKVAARIAGLTYGPKTSILSGLKQL